MDEARKTNALRGPAFIGRYLGGKVIDIGAGADLVAPHAERFDLEEGDANLITQPVLIVEVASDSTEDYDRGEKFAAYRWLPSLQEYVLVQQTKPLVEVFRKRTEWQPETYGLTDEFALESVGLKLPVATFYRRVAF